MVFFNVNAPSAHTLDDQNAFTLNRHSLQTLQHLCKERDLSTDGGKVDLVKRLVQWKAASGRGPYNLRLRPNQQVGPADAKARLRELTPAPPKLDMQISDSSTVAEKRGKAATNRGNGSLFISAQLLEDEGNDAGEIPYASLKVARKLGSGGFKDCFAGTYNGLPVAIGKLRATNFREEDVMEVRHEIGVLKQLRHDNIVRFIGMCHDENNLCIVTELCENGDLFEYMKRTPRPPFTKQISMLHDIAHGVAYLHSRRPGIIHRDLKSQNILVSRNQRAKINDFGLARIVPKASTLLHTQCGTPNWQAPEMWASNPSYTEKVDVYACGLIFWEVLQWAHEPFPYHDMSEHQLYKQVRDHNVRPNLDKLVRRYPSNLLVLISQMWDADPQKRPSMNAVLDHLNEY